MHGCFSAGFHISPPCGLAVNKFLHRKGEREGNYELDGPKRGSDIAYEYIKSARRQPLIQSRN